MFEIALNALATLLTPEVFVFVVLGVGLGALVGILPGLGGMTGMALLLPFVYGMDPTAGLALFIGMLAITQTSDTFPSVMLGVPGSSSSQATIVDGYPMARQGRGSEALAAAFTASLLGGLVGAVAFFAAIFLARPVILAFGSPQLFMLVLLGLSMVGILSQGAARTGLLSGFIGLILGSVGGAPTAAVYRFSFDQVYLFDGIPLPILAMGLFAIPELVDLLVQGRSVAGSQQLRGSMLPGILATIRHKWLVFRSALIGVFIGALPGLGGSVVDWISYGVASQTAKDNSQFGRGDIRGVIAPESSNNAKEAGALLPTLLFGIPGSGSMAMLLGGLTLLGLQTGPRLVTDNISFVVMMAWTLAIANVLATGLCLGLSRWVVKLTLVPATIFTPFLFSILVVASYQSSRHWGDIIGLLVIGAFGWVMKQIGWARPPLLIGFVLSVPAERYLWTSMGTFGFSWIYQPLTIVIGCLIVGILLFGFRIRKTVDERTVEATVDEAP